MMAANGLTVRVWVSEMWDTVRLEAAPDWTVARLKSEALRRATGREPDPEAYTVKYRGGRVLDEGVTLSGLGAPDRAAFIVLPSRRRPAT
jgi:hypothetical protein